MNLTEAVHVTGGGLTVRALDRALNPEFEPRTCGDIYVVLLGRPQGIMMDELNAVT